MFGITLLPSMACLYQLVTQTVIATWRVDGPRMF